MKHSGPIHVIEGFSSAIESKISAEMHAQATKAYGLALSLCVIGCYRISYLVSPRPNPVQRALIILPLLFLWSSQHIDESNICLSQRLSPSSNPASWQILLSPSFPCPRGKSPRMPLYNVDLLYQLLCSPCQKERQVAEERPIHLLS